MPATRIKSRWVAGNLQFITEGGDVILELDREGLLALGNEAEQMPVLHYYFLQDAVTGTDDFELTFPTEIVDVWVTKNVAAGNAGASTVQIQNNDGDVITDLMNIRNTDQGDVVRAANVNNSNARIAPENNELRISRVKAEGADDNSVHVYVLGRRFSG